MRRDLVKCKLDSSSNSSGTKLKEEDENATFTSKEQKEQWNKKKDISKIKCFQCGELGHYTTQCPLKKKDKNEKHDLKVASAHIEEEEFSMITRRWGDIELQLSRILEESTFWINTLLREPRSEVAR